MDVERNAKALRAAAGAWALLCLFLGAAPSAAADASAPLPPPVPYPHGASERGAPLKPGEAVFPGGEPTRSWRRSAPTAPADDRAYVFTAFSLGTGASGEGIFAASAQSASQCPEVYLMASGSAEPVQARLLGADKSTGVMFVSAKTKAPGLALSTLPDRAAAVGEKAWIVGLSDAALTAAEADLASGGVFDGDKSTTVLEWRLLSVSSASPSASAADSMNLDGSPVLAADGSVSGIVVSTGDGYPLAASAKMISAALLRMKLAPAKDSIAPPSRIDPAAWAASALPLRTSGSLVPLVCAGKDWRSKAYYGAR